MKQSLLLFGSILYMFTSTMHAMEEQAPLVQTHTINYGDKVCIGAFGGLIVGGLAEISCILMPQCNAAMQPINNRIMGFALFTFICPLLGAGVSTLSAYVKNKIELKNRNDLV